MKTRLPIVVGLGTALVLVGGSLSTVTAAASTTYTTVRFSADPLATAGSLAAGQSVSLTLRLKNGTAAAPGAVVNLSYSTSVKGDAVSVPAAQCGGQASLSGSAISCTSDANGQIAVTYTASSAPTGQGLVDILAQSPGGQLNAHTHYNYCTVFRFSPAPVAPSGSLAAGATATVTVSARNASDVAVPNSAVYLSFLAASGGGHAAVGSTALTSTPAAFTLDGSGQLLVTYTAPATLPSTGVDSIIAQDRQNTPTVSTPDPYAFSASVPVISIGDAASVEAHVKPGIPLRNTLTLSAPQPNPVTVQYTTQCGLGDKTCSEDFHEVHTPTTVTFAAGTTHTSITVRVFAYGGNFGGEDYNESYFVHLSNPSGAILGRSVGEATILPNVTVPQTVWVGDAGLMPITAANTPVGFTVTLTAPQSTAVIVNYATSDVTAVAGVDYAATSGSVVIPAGSNSVVITVNWLAHAPPASTRTFTLTISSPGGPPVGRATGSGSVLAG